MRRSWLPLLLCCTVALSLPFPAPDEVDSDESRRVLGSSVVTSVSVIMDLGNGTKKYFADAAGRPVPKPTAASLVGSPAELLNPDRYEFYTFDEAGDLVKRLMTLDEIQSIIANGESDIGEPGRPNYYHQNLPPDSLDVASAASSSTVTDKVEEEAVATDIGEMSSAVPGVHDVVASVQNVLKGQLEASKNKVSSPKPVPSPPSLPTSQSTTTTSNSSWDMILPGIISNAPSVRPSSTHHPLSSTSSIPTSSQKISTPSTARPSPITEAVKTTITTNAAQNVHSSTIVTKKPTYSTSSVSTNEELTGSSILPVIIKETSSVIPPVSQTSIVTASTSAKPSYSSSSSTFSKPITSIIHTSTTRRPITSQTTLGSTISNDLSEVPSLKTKKPVPVTESKPLISQSYISRPTIGISETSVTKRPLVTIEHTQFPSSINKISPAASNNVEAVTLNNEYASSASEKPLVSPSSTATSNRIPPNKYTTTEKVPGLSTTFSIHTLPPSAATFPSKFTTNKPVKTTTNKPTKTTENNFESTQPSEPTMIMISSSETTNHDDYAAAQQFINIFSPNNKVKVNTTSTFSTVNKTPKPITSEHTEPASTSSRPSSTAQVNTTSQSNKITASATTPGVYFTKVETLPQKPLSSTTTQSRLPIKPLRTTTPPRITTTYITKTTTTAKPYHSSSYSPLSTQKTTSRPTIAPTTKTTTAVNSVDENAMSTVELLKTSVILKPTTYRPLLSVQNEAENALINEASGFVPAKIESPLGMVSLPATANSNLDMPPELAESVLGVLSQVADMGGAATTIDYGEDALFILGNSVTTTQRGISDYYNSNTHISNKNTQQGDLQTTKIFEDKSRMTESTNSYYVSTNTEKLQDTNPTTVNNEAKTEDVITTEFVTEQPTHAIVLKSNIKDQTTEAETGTTSYSYTTAPVSEKEDITTVTTIPNNEIIADNKINLESKIVEKIYNQLTANNNGNVEIDSLKKDEITYPKVELLKTTENKFSGLKQDSENVKKVPIKEAVAAALLGEKTQESSNEDTITESESTESESTESTESTTSNEFIEERDDSVLELDSTTDVSETTTETQTFSILKKDNNKADDELESYSSGETRINTEEIFTTDNPPTEAEITTIQDVKKIIPEETTTYETTVSSSFETAESSTQSSKEPDTSTPLITKYKKNDNELAEESLQANNTSNATIEPVSSKTEDVDLINKKESQNVEEFTTVSQETTTQNVVEVTETVQNEDTTVTNIDKVESSNESTKTEFQNNVKYDQSKVDGLIIKTIIKTSAIENAASREPAETFIKEQTTEIPYEFITDLTTNKLNIETETFTEANADFISTTYNSAIELADRETTSADPSVKNIENNEEIKTPTSEVKENNSELERLPDSTEKLITFREPDVIMSNSGSTSWTKIPSIMPQQTSQNNISISTTAKPVNRITTTTEDITTSADILKISHVNEEKLKDNKVKIRPDLQRPNPYPPVDLDPAPQENLGLEATSSTLGEDVLKFAELCNELAFRLWASVTAKGLTTSRSLIMSPFAVTSLLAMVFLGARGPTSGQMNDILRLDDMVTFNPHQVFRNVTESVALSRTPGVATAAFVRELYSDRAKGKLLEFYKERVQQFYDGHVEEVNFNTIGDLVRRRTNLLIKRQTRGRIPEYLRGSNILLRPPLAVFSANVFQTDCSQASTHGRDGEMYFTVMPAVRQRRLVPVPAVVWFNGFLAGYEPVLDATAVSIGSEQSLVSLIMVLPGQQGQQAPGDGLQRLETRLIDTSYRRGAWSKLLRSLVPRPGLELQIPRFSHRSLLNVTAPLQRMGLKDLFSAEHADLRGINGLSNDLHLSDIVQVNTFSTCAEESIGSRHHVEVYPTSPQRSGREELDDSKKEQTYFDDLDDLGLSSLPLALRPRQARLPDAPRLRFDRPFLYFVRHNPTGLILHMGRFNPRLLH